MPVVCGSIELSKEGLKHDLSSNFIHEVVVSTCTILSTLIVKSNDDDVKYNPALKNHLIDQC